MEVLDLELHPGAVVRGLLLQHRVLVTEILNFKFLVKIGGSNFETPQDFFFFTIIVLYDVRNVVSK